MKLPDKYSVASLSASYAVNTFVLRNFHRLAAAPHPNAFMFVHSFNQQELAGRSELERDIAETFITPTVRSFSSAKLRRSFISNVNKSLKDVFDKTGKIQALNPQQFPVQVRCFLKLIIYY